MMVIDNKLINIGHNKVMYFLYTIPIHPSIHPINDGSISDDGDIFRVYRGELTADKNDVEWEIVESMKTIRTDCIAFKLKDHVYVTGGGPSCAGRRTDTDLICDRFDLNENKWVNCHHTSPYTFFEWSTSVVVSADESFAVIIASWFYTETDIGQITGFENVMIFTEEKGFQLIPIKALSPSNELYPFNPRLPILL